MKFCASCGAPILWAHTAAGKKMPVDARLSAVGNLFVFETNGSDGPLEAVSVTATDDPRVRAALSDPGRSRATSHFATCPNAAQHRRART